MKAGKFYSVLFDGQGAGIAVELMTMAQKYVNGLAPDFPEAKLAAAQLHTATTLVRAVEERLDEQAEAGPCERLDRKKAKRG